jgi:hypothetical protein
MREVATVRGRREACCRRRGLPFADTRPPCGLAHNVGITLSRLAGKAKAHVGSRIRRAITRNRQAACLRAPAFAGLSAGSLAEAARAPGPG